MKIITDAEELLALLRENPARRAVELRHDEDRPAVREYKGDGFKRGCFLAMIEEDGTANELLYRAYNASFDGEAETWARLPLRYGPFCGTWVLPEHPEALQKPLDDDVPF
jgi:hypothetical protein